MPLSQLEEIHIYVNSLFTEYSYGHLVARFCEILKNHSIISWKLLRAMRGKDEQRFTQSISELVAAIGGGDGARYIFSLLIDEAYNRVPTAAQVPKPPKQVKPVSSSDFANWLRGQMTSLLADPEKIAPALATMIGSDGSLLADLNYHLDNPATGTSTWLCPFCLRLNVQFPIFTTPPLNRANVLKHFDTKHFNRTLLPPRRATGDSADSAPSPSPSLSPLPSPSLSPLPSPLLSPSQSLKKTKRTAASSEAPSPPPLSSPSAPARSTSGTGAPPHL